MGLRGFWLLETARMVFWVLGSIVSGLGLKSSSHDPGFVFGLFLFEISAIGVSKIFIIAVATETVTIAISIVIFSAAMCTLGYYDDHDRLFRRR